MNNPLVTIIMSAYNDEKYIHSAIESIINQTYKNWKLILINDDSSDNTEAVIKPFLKNTNRINYIKNKKTNGLITNLNYALDLADGKYIARLDSDDIWIDSEKLNDQVNYLENHKDYVLTGTWGFKISSDETPKAPIMYPVTDKKIHNYFLIENCFIHSSVLIRKSTLDKVGFYDPEFPSAEDYGLWVKLGTSGKLYNLPKYMTGYRVNPKGISYNKYAEQISSSIKIVNKFKDYYPFYTIGLLLWYVRKFFPRDLREALSRNFRSRFVSK